MKQTATSGDSAWDRRVLALLMALCVLRTSYLASSPLELCVDEAYYWDWSRHPAWGYYSKPPLIAWLIGFTTALGGNSEFAIRLPAAALSTLGLWPVYRLGAELYSPRVGFWSVAATAATPGMVAMSQLMTIDAPFLCAWAFAVWLAWRLLSAEEPAWHDVWPAIIATGLGLLSKQTMAAIIPLSALWLLANPTERRKLRSLPVWGWWLGSLACLIPVLIWNASHDWITLQHTREHFEQQTVSWTEHLEWFAEFWGSQFGVFSPLTFGLMIVLTLWGLATWSRQDRASRYLLCLGTVPMLAVAVLSLLQPVQPNWPAAFMLPSLILLSAWGCRMWPETKASHSIDSLLPRHSFLGAVALGAGLSAAVYLIPFTLPTSSLAGGKFDPTTRLRGWRPLGTTLGQELATMPRPARTLIITTTGRGPTCLLAYYMPQHPHVYSWNSTGIVFSQYDIWGGPPFDAKGYDALIVSDENQEFPAALAQRFATVAPLTRVSSFLGGKRWERLDVRRAYGFRGWPTDAQNIPHP